MKPEVVGMVSSSSSFTDMEEPSFLSIDIQAPPPPDIEEKLPSHDHNFVPVSLKFVDVRFSIQLTGSSNSCCGCFCRMPLGKLCSCFCFNKNKKESNNSGSSSTTTITGSSSGNNVIHKEILHGVSGYVAPGEILAMMGPSGSGKTTLLNILGGRTKMHHKGSVTYNDMAYTKALKRRMGFVTQDDVLFMHLTVQETLRYAALLRLPKEWSKQQKIERADNILRELGLEKCKDTVIGGPFLRGISGGERKRVCIGQEILINPSILMLDEPTSGLDSTIALKLIQLLQGLAVTGRTIVTTIHQPSSRIFHMFDKLMLLSEGHTMYFGKAAEAMSYFNSMGLSSTMLVNPADFLLDLANGNINDTNLSPELDQNIRNLAGRQEGSGQRQEAAVRKCLVDHFQAENRELISSTPQFVGNKLETALDKRIWVTSWSNEFVVLMSRGFKERRHEFLSWLRVVQILLSAIIAGLVWWQSKHDTSERLQDQAGLVFFISVFWGYFPAFMAIYTFPQERAMLAKERASDMYRLSSYFLSRTLGDLPLNLVLPLMFIIITYFMAHLAMTVQAFLYTVLALFLIIVAAEGLGLFIGAVMMDTKHATTLASVVLLIFMLTGGFFTHRIFAFMAWLKYVSYTSYSYKLLLKIQYSKNEVIDCATPTGCISIATSNVFHDMTLDRPYEEILCLLVMALGYRVLAYFALRKTNTG